MSAGFDHRVEGTSEADWVSSRLEDLEAVDLPAGTSHLLVVSAHPDDESLGAGGFIASAARRGVRVSFIIATDGEGSHPQSTSHSPARLAGIRRAEALAALAQLAEDAHVSFLGLPDGGLGGCAHQLEAAIAAAVTPETLVLTPWRGDRHPDHEACAFAARAVARTGLSGPHWQVPIWAWHWADPQGDAIPWTALRRRELGDSDARAKSAALDCYRSQQRPLSDQPGDETILPAYVLEHFHRSFETFVIEPAHAAGSADYFDDLYSSDPDPWELADRFYEHRKRQIVMASLPRPRFGRAFEPGCATGLLTELLAGRCDSVTAWDASAHAIRLAEPRLAPLVNVSLAQGAIPGEWPEGQFDLVVLSEVGYYCDDLATLAERVARSLTPDGVVVACHWRHEALDHPHSAQDVHDLVGARLHSQVRHVEEDFLLEVWSVRPESVARADSIVP